MDDEIKQNISKIKRTFTYHRKQLEDAYSRIYNLSESKEISFDEFLSIKNKCTKRVETMNGIIQNYELFLSENDLLYDESNNETVPHQQLSEYVKFMYDLERQIIHACNVIEKKHSSNTNDVNLDDTKFASAMDKITQEFTKLRCNDTNSIKTISIPPPKWDGSPKNFKSWKVRISQYFSSAKLSGDKEQLLVITNSDVLPQNVLNSILDCTSVEGINGIWARLEEKVPQSAILKDILYELKSTRPMRSQCAYEMRFVLDRLVDFSRRMIELGFESELASPTVNELIRNLVEPSLFYEYNRQNRFHGHEPDIPRLIRFLRSETEAHELLEGNKPRSSNQHQVNDFTNEPKRTGECPFCVGAYHLIIHCPQFTNKNAQERRKMIFQSKRCFNCFNQHLLYQCKLQKRKCDSCSQTHHKLLSCMSQNTNTSSLNPFAQSYTNNNSTQSYANNTIVDHAIHNTYDQETYSPTTFVKVQDCKGNWCTLVALLDEGANTSLLKEDTAVRLGIHGKPFKFTYGVAGGGKVSEIGSHVSILIKSMYGNDVHNLDVITVKKPAHDSPGLSSSIFTQYPYILPAKECIPSESSEIDLLIGYDYAYLFVPLEVCRSPYNIDTAPTAVRCEIGWKILGGKMKSSTNLYSCNFLHLENKSYELDLQAIYKSDMLGVKPTSLCACSDKEIIESEFIKHCRINIKITDDGAITVLLPWKDGFPDKLPYNKSLAISRMYSLEKKLGKEMKLQDYNEEICALLENGFVRKLSVSESCDGRGWYLPHRAVYKPEKSTKVRIVWDSASKFKELCLNDGLHKGPDLLNSLPVCLLAWRRDRVAFVADIQKMFNQICLHEHDQLYHRFVWRFGDLMKAPTSFQWLRLPFGDKPAPDVANMAMHILAEANSEIYPIGADIIKNTMYMDDILDSRSSVEDALVAIHQVESILSKGGFQVKTWDSNHESVNKNEEDFIQVLGHTWNKKLDCLTLGQDIYTRQFSQFTRRGLLALVAKLWDPMGIISPVSIGYRQNLQQLWTKELSWDDPVEESDLNYWQAKLSEIENIVNFKIQRSLKPLYTVGKPQIHGFSDGGEKGYGAVIWLRWQTTDGFVLRFALAKALVAPLKKKSIPRLELMAVVLMTRMVILVKQMFDFENMYFWVDSKVVLSWIRSAPFKFKPFVSTRIQEIHDTLPDFINQVRYIPSSKNPADALTKGISIEELNEWHCGPKFLLFEESKWPKEEIVLEANMVYQIEQEVRNKPYKIHLLKEINSWEFILTKHFSDWLKIVNVVCFMKRVFIKKDHKPDSIIISPSERKNAELAIFRISQSVFNTSNKNKLLSLDPKMGDDCIIRAEGRLSKLPLPESLKHPIILCKESKLVELYLIYEHKRLGHQGYRFILSSLFKKGILVIGCTQLLKSIASKCIFCRIRRKKLLTQQMGLLPPFRGKPGTAVFNCVAVDYFGPLKAKLTRNTSIDTWIMIVTCTTTRAIHLELVDASTSVAFIFAWRRFVCSRGVHPTEAFSDRGTSFVGAHRIFEWIQSWNLELIQSKISELGTEFKFRWDFNIPSASHMNGAVESLIRSCRKGLDAMVDYHRRKFTILEWQTILAEVCYLVNSRPLFPKIVDPLAEPMITANDLLHPYDQCIVPQPVNTDTTNIIDILNISQQRVQMFWDIWIKNMPPHLLARSKWFHPRENLEKGDLVILLKEKVLGKPAPRGTWKRGLVDDVFPGVDGLVRKCNIITINETGKRVLLERPIHKLTLIATKKELDNGFTTTNIS